MPKLLDKRIIGGSADVLNTILIGVPAGLPLIVAPTGAALLLGPATSFPGVRGPTGPTGLGGAPGFGGFPAPPGVKGATGSAGQPGPLAGPPGTLGATGPVGGAGPTGDPGATGTLGFPGPQGTGQKLAVAGFLSPSTWAVPATTTNVKVTTVGGGGAGGWGAIYTTQDYTGADGGYADGPTIKLIGGKGGPGAAIETWIPVTAGSNLQVIVGGGGAANISNSGNPGTTSQLLDQSGIALVTAGGGSGGLNANIFTPGANGARGTATSIGPLVYLNADLGLRFGYGGVGRDDTSASGGQPGAVLIEYIAVGP